MINDTCIDCGYSLRGHSGDTIRCPECGSLYGPKERLRWREWNRPLSADEKKRSGLLPGFIGCSVGAVIVIAVPDIDLWTRAIAFAGIVAFYAFVLFVFLRHAKSRWSAMGTIIWSFMTATHALCGITLLEIIGRLNETIWQASGVKSSYLPMTCRLFLSAVALGVYAYIFRRLLAVWILMAFWLMSGGISVENNECKDDRESPVDS